MNQSAVSNDSSQASGGAASGGPAPSHDEIMSALFAHMVIQNTNMALLFLGKAPHPQTGEHIHDLEAARMFIDQLEMLEAKTKGNLSPEEQKLLQQSLMHLRMAFVEAVEHPPRGAPAAKPVEAPAQGTPPPAGEAPSPVTGAGADEPQKRFSKKF
jgi:hypothetical protein